MFVNFNILNQLGSPAINSNTFANRPAAGQTGRLFVSTDTFEIYRDNGTSWDLIGGPGSSTVTGTGASGQVTYWTGASTIAGNNNLFWDITNSRLGIGTTTPGHKLQINGTGTLLSLNGGSDTYMLFAGNGADQYQIGYTDNALDYRRFSIYDSTGAKEVLTIDKQSRNVGINYQYSSLADQPAYTFDVSGSIRSTDSTFLATNGTSQVGINTVSPVATALIQANKTDGYGLYLNYTTNAGSGTTATALWAINTTAGSGFAAVIEEKTPNTTSGQYPLAIKHSLSSGTAAAGMGTGLHFQLPDDLGNFKTTQLTVETTDAGNATYTTRYRFMAQVNNTSTPLAYLTSVGLGIGNVIPAYKLDVNGTVRAFGVGNTGNFLAVDTNPGGASVNLNPQYGTGLPILYTNGAFPLLFGTNNTENMRLTTAGNLGLGTATPTGASGITLAINGGAGQSRLALKNNTTGDASGNGFQIGTSGTAAFIEQRENDSLTFSTNATERARFTSNGNFLIGNTTDTGQKLQVTGTTYITGNTSIGANVNPGSRLNVYISESGATPNPLIRLQNSGNSFQARILLTDGNTNDALIGYQGGSTSATQYIGFGFGSVITQMVFNAAGQLGIGTTTPANLLDITRSSNSNSTGGLTLTNTDNSGYGSSVSWNLKLNSVAGVWGRIAVEAATSTSTYMPFFTTIGSALGERMRINNNGDLLLGTTLGISSGRREIVAQSSNGALLSLGVPGTADSFQLVCDSGPNALLINKSNTPMIFYTNNTRRVDITAGGNFLIGTTTDNGYKLQVNGAAYIGTSSTSNISTYIASNVAGVEINGGTGSASVGASAYMRIGDTISAKYWIQQINNNADLQFWFYDGGSWSTKQKLNNNGSIQTTAPSGGTAAAWKLGSRVAATVALDTTQYIELDVGGTLYKLAIVT